MRRSGKTLFFRMLCVTLAAAGLFPAPALPAEAAGRQHTVLVLCDRLCLDDLRDNSHPHLFYFAEQAAIGLMNCAAAGSQTPEAALLALSCGQQTPAEPTDGQAADDTEPVFGEPGTARVVYFRRTGRVLQEGGNQRFVCHLGVAPLARRGLDRGRLGAALSGALPPVRTLLIGNADADMPDRSAALLTADALGVCPGSVRIGTRPNAAAPFGRTDDPIALAQAADAENADFTVIRMGDTTRAEARRTQSRGDSLQDSPQGYLQDYLQARADALRRLDLLIGLLTSGPASAQRNVLLVSARPLPDTRDHPGEWQRLTPVLAIGPAFPPGRLCSPTTRTPGLIANIDLAPTVLQLFGIAPPPAMVGRPFFSIPDSPSGADRLAAVARLDYVAVLNSRSTIPLMVLVGGLCVLGTVAGLLRLRLRGPEAGRPFGTVPVFAANVPAALLFAPLLPPPTLSEYGLRILVWTAVLTAGAFLVARLLRTAPGVVAALQTLLVVAADTFAGQPLLKDSLLSSYPLSGIRYYGVGNEYLGVLVGFALLGAFGLLDTRGVPFPPRGAARRLRAGVALLWIGLLLLLGWPGLGANAGSLAVTGTGFGVGLALLCGRAPGVRLAIGCALSGVAASFLFAALDAWLPTGSQGAASHAGAALRSAAGGRGIGYLGEIAERKLAMSLRILASPWTLLGLVTVAAVLVLTRTLAGPSLEAVLLRRPWMRGGLRAVGAAALAALLFKDSGFVTATFLIGTVCAALLAETLAPTR